MSPTARNATRRTLLTAGAATAATLLAGSTAAQASDSTGTGTGTGTGTDIGAELRALEEQHSARVGVFAHHLGTKKTVVHRADELFPMCSVFKTLAAAAVLRDPDRHGEVLYRVVHYTEADLVDGSDQTRAHLAEGMTIEQLADVAIRYSDNGAGNLILRELGGPTAVTRFARSLGDQVTRLDRWETELNSAEPDRITDTTSPRAIAPAPTAGSSSATPCAAPTATGSPPGCSTTRRAPPVSAPGSPRPGRSPTRPAAATTAPPTTSASPGRRPETRSSSRS